MPRGDPLLAWYAPRRRAYPWRGERDPYRVLVAEVMLQQTQARRVAPAYGAFLRTFPSLRALARAPRADVLRAWSGLGYNRRAALLHEAAGAVVRDHAGRLPRDPAVLRGLPGIGPYTAAAVAALAFGAPLPAVDVNVARVVSRARLGRDRAPVREVELAASRWLAGSDPADWNQAVMDLGRGVCRAVPRCGACPLAARCRFRRMGAPPSPPRRRGEPFAGSAREVRGRVLRLVLGGRTTLARLAREMEEPLVRVAAAVRSLHREELLRAGPAALAGRGSGRVGPVV
ncbi:MAG TPA: A/G-specific adenine glycosylase [Actinomycetota bacterium]|nr:A/G-specific adenine glycosylase [Actinomycetota bacterium]